MFIWFWTQKLASISGKAIPERVFLKCVPSSGVSSLKKYNYENAFQETALPHGLFLWIGFACLKAAELLQRDIYFYNKSPAVPVLI